VLSNGQLLHASLSTLGWERILPNITDLNAMTNLQR
jgi:hypothetical protein